MDSPGGCSTILCLCAVCVNIYLQPALAFWRPWSHHRGVELWKYIEEFHNDEAAAKQLNISVRTAQCYRLKTRWPKPSDVPRIIERTGGMVDWEGVYMSKPRLASAAS